jgi:long-chain acyl-CoA synthetase
MTAFDAQPRGFYQYAASEPDAVAVVDVDGTQATRGELLRRVNRLSNALLTAGLVMDDRVALLVHNSVRYFDWVMAAGQIGLHPVPLNFHLTSGEIAYIVENSGSKVVAVGADLAFVADEALASIGYDGSRVALDAAPGYISYEALLGPHADEPPAVRTAGSVMLYTAGTTGRPKGVLWPARAGVTPEMSISATVPMFARRGMSVGGVSLVCGPLYHGAPGAQGSQALHWAQSVVLMDRWDSERALQLIEEHRVTHVQMAPIHFARLLDLPEAVRAKYDVSSLRAVTHAGAGCPVDVKQAMMDWFGPVLYEYYAASEGYGTSITPQQWLAHPGSVGHAASDGAEIVIVDEEGGQLPAGEVGMVYLRLPGLPESEYLGDPEKTAAARRPGGFRTFGDMGYIDPEGWLFLVDRRADMILSGGVNVYPAEVEQQLRQHPAVGDVGVVGVPDAEWGQSVLAIVVPGDGAHAGPALEAELRRHCESGLAKFKCPRHYDFRAELPYSGAGKLLRRALREPYW